MLHLRKILWLGGVLQLLMVGFFAAAATTLGLKRLREGCLNLQDFKSSSAVGWKTSYGQSDYGDTGDTRNVSLVGL